MYLRYYDGDRFPFPQAGGAGPFAAFPGTPALAQAGGGLGFFRPNQALQRSVYGRPPKLAGLGQDLNVAVDPTLLLAGAGVLAVALLLMGGRKAKRSVQRYRRKRITRKRAALQRQLAALA